MPRRPKGIKRESIVSGKILSSEEVDQDLFYGEFKPIRQLIILLGPAEKGGWDSKDFKPEGVHAKNFVDGTKSMFFRFILKCAREKNGEKLRLLADWVEREERGAVDPFALVVRYAMQCGEAGESVRQTLARLKIRDIRNYLSTCGFEVDESVIRKMLNSAEVRRERGRPK